MWLRSFGDEPLLVLVQDSLVSAPGMLPLQICMICVNIRNIIYRPGSSQSGVRRWLTSVSSARLVYRQPSFTGSSLVPQQPNGRHSSFLDWFSIAALAVIRVGPVYFLEWLKWVCWSPEGKTAAMWWVETLMCFWFFSAEFILNSMTVYYWCAEKCHQMSSICYKMRRSWSSLEKLMKPNNNNNWTTVSNCLGTWFLCFRFFSFLDLSMHHSRRASVSVER